MIVIHNRDLVYQPKQQNSYTDTNLDGVIWTLHHNSVLLHLGINFCKYGFACRKIVFLAKVLVHFKENSCQKLISFLIWSQDRISME